VTFEFDINLHGFMVRPAAAGDAKAVRMLLPDLPDAAKTFVAVDGNYHRVIGAASVTCTFRPKPVRGPGVDLHVIEPCRGHGVGRELLRSAESFARTAAADALFATRRVPLDSDQMHSWERLGFRKCETVREHTLPLKEFEPRLAPLVDRFRQQGRIPDSARIIPLYQADLPAVLRLHLDCMGGDRGDIYRKLRGEGSGAYHPRYSRVLVMNGQVKGAILGHRKNEHTFFVDANILDDSVRGRWANVLLKLEATRGVLPLGIETFEYTTFDHYADTRGFTEKLGGVTTGTTALMFRQLTAP
jgi:GNAT superfamily N-acetyltransferase